MLWGGSSTLFVLSIPYGVLRTSLYHTIRSTSKHDSTLELNIWIACHNMTCYVENLTLTTVESQKSVVVSKETCEPCTAQPWIPARQPSSRSIRTERQHMFGGNVYYDNTVPSH